MYFRTVRTDEIRPAIAEQSRRQTIARERPFNKQHRPRRPTLSSGRRMVAASIAALLLLGVYVLPGVSHGAPSAIAQPNARTNAKTQDVTLASFDSTPGAMLIRDGYRITAAPRPAFKFAGSGYAPFSSDFSNNPSNLVIQWPFDHGVPIASGFGPRRSPCSGCSSFHEGLDLLGGNGTPIQAIADGVVSEVGNPSGAYGVFAKIDHVIDGQNVSSLYGHMQLGSLAMAVGQHVIKGQIVGRVGSTGASSGPHLHLSILLNGTEQVDPFAWMKQKVGS